MSPSSLEEHRLCANPRVAQRAATLENPRVADIWSLTVVSDRIHDHLNLHLQCEHINIHGLEASDLPDEVVSGRRSDWSDGNLAMDVGRATTRNPPGREPPPLLSSSRGQELWKFI